MPRIKLPTKPFCYLLFAICYLLIAGCSHAIPRIGISGHYQEGREDVTKPRGGNIDRAIADLEAIVLQEPTYKDSLTLLGRAYYKKGRYRDAGQILERALAVNKDDEIAWIVLGLAQMRLGEDQKGLESVKGGLTLLARAMKDGYRGYRDWDPSGVVRSSLRRTIFLATKGLEEKDALVQSVETSLDRIDDEDWRKYREDIMLPTGK